MAPFVKWAGGKRSLVRAIGRHFPRAVGTYHEPFVGGGAVFFALASRIDRAVLSDLNDELMTAYRMVKSRVHEVIGRLRLHAVAHRRAGADGVGDAAAYYSHVRSTPAEGPVEVAARFLYLNRTCFNGLYRVNRAGRFNVPPGRYSNPDICNPERLLRASRALARATCVTGDFERTVEARAGDWVYCDPPYDGGFVGYQAGGFSVREHRRLRSVVERWRGSGVHVLVSNADTRAMRALYQGFALERLRAPRAINADGAGRGKVSELLFRG